MMSGIDVCAHGIQLTDTCQIRCTCGHWCSRHTESGECTGMVTIKTAIDEHGVVYDPPKVAEDPCACDRFVEVGGG